MNPGDNTPTTPPRDQPTIREVTPGSTDELPLTSEAIAYLENFEFNSDRGTQLSTSTGNKDNLIEAKKYMMFASPAPKMLPKVVPDPWPHKGENPNPVTIGKARKYLAAAYARIDCDKPEAGIHGFAWIVETKATWGKREGTKEVPIPTKKARLKVGDPEQLILNTYEIEAYRLYHHLLIEGQKVLVDWFGAARFCDMHQNGILPPTTTPNEMLEHLKLTYGTPRDYRRCMIGVEKTFQAPYDPREGVETYFMRLDEVRENSEFLEDRYTDKQLMNRALRSFGDKYGRDATKTEDKWEEKDEEKKTWSNFKQHWKTYIHKFSMDSNKVQQAHQAELEALTARMNAKLDGIQHDMHALQAESRGYQNDNLALSARYVQMHEALQSGHQERHSSTSSDDISALTGVVSRVNSVESRLNAKMDRLLAAMDTNSAGTNTTERTDRNSNSTAGPTTAELLDAEKTKPPSFYSYMYNGKGLQYKKYCWKCGCNTTHWTRQCPILDKELIARYRNASFKDLMGGSTHNLDRRNKWQTDFNFDSY